MTYAGLYLLICCCVVGDCVFIFDGGYLPSSDLYILDLSSSLKTLCKLAVIQYDLDQSELTHNIKWELSLLMTNSNGTLPGMPF